MAFTAPTLTSGLTINAYDYEISTDGGVTVSVSTNTSAWLSYYGNADETSSPYIDGYAVSYCQLGTTCSYRMRAEIGADNFQTPWSAWVAETPIGSAPTLDSVDYNDNGASLAFTAPTLTSGLTINAYDYEISTDGGVTVSVSTNTSAWLSYYGNADETSSPYVDGYAASFCLVGTTCSYRMRAEIGADNFQSPWSDWVTLGGVASSTTSCSTDLTCTATLVTPSQTIDVSTTKGSPSASASIGLSVAQDTLPCSSMDYSAPVATLTDSGFAAGSTVTVTDKVPGLPDKDGALVCYQPFAVSAPAPVLLGKCHGKGPAPCAKSFKESNGSVVATLILPTGDPRFHVGGAIPRITGMSPAIAKPGKKLTITGLNMSEITGVTIGSIRVRIVKTTPTKVRVIVPTNATAGVVTVNSLAGASVSTAVLNVT